MGNLDVSSLFINIYFKETIDICTKTLFEKLKEQRFYQKQNLRNFYFLLQKNSVLLFNGKLYKQADGVTLGSSLGLKPTNAFLVYFQNYPSDFKPHYYRRYVDDIFVLFTSLEHLESFFYILNVQRANYN